MGKSTILSILQSAAWHLFETRTHERKLQKKALSNQKLTIEHPKEKVGRGNSHILLRYSELLIVLYSTSQPLKTATGHTRVASALWWWWWDLSEGSLLLFCFVLILFPLQVTP